MGCVEVVVSLSPILGLAWFWPIFESYLRGLFESLRRHPIVVLVELVKVCLDTRVEREEERRLKRLCKGLSQKGFGTFCKYLLRIL